MKSLLFILFFGLITCLAQVPNNQSNNGRLIKTRPSAYITFDSSIKIKPRYIGESENQLLLRFHNNSIWNMSVEVNGCRPEQEQCMAFYKVHRLPLYEDKIKDSEIPVGYGQALHVSSARTVKS